MIESSREGSRPTTYFGVTAVSSMTMPETFPVVLKTWVGTSSKLAALAFTKAEISSNKAKKPEAIFLTFAGYEATLQITNHKSQVTSHKSQVTNHKLQVKSPESDYNPRKPATAYSSEKIKNFFSSGFNRLTMSSKKASPHFE